VEERRVLKVGVGRALRYEPDWLLFLDHDALLLGGAVEKALEVVDRLPPSVRGRVGAAFLGSAGGDCSVREYRYGWFSGTLIRADIASKVCCRDDFFIDQADHDMYARVRELGYLTVLVNCRLVDRELGSKRWIRFLGRVEYEPPWRYYYIVRNSTKLLIEGRMDLRTYVKQLRYWGVRILLTDGVKAFAKPLALGLMHALLGRLGYMDRRFLEK
jgi:rhamnosyltransferase